MHEVIKDLPLDQIIIQSFDPRVLVALNSKYPRYTLAYLISNQKSWQKNVEELTFTPDIYSPHHRLISSTSVKELQEAGIKVIPWTVNSRNDIQKVIEMNVDGLITDYPGLAINTLKSITNK